MSWIQIAIESIFGIGLFVNAALFIPQAIKLLREKDSRELSLTTFLGFNIIQLFTILHGFFYKDYILVIGYTLSFITCGLVTLLILLYRIKNKRDK